MWAAMLHSRQVIKHRTDPILHYCEPVMIQCLSWISFQVVFFFLKQIHLTVKECDYQFNINLMLEVTLEFF